MEKEYLINLNKLYNEVTIKEYPLEYVITKANCDIYILINDILYGDKDIDVDIINEIYTLFCISIKSAAKVNAGNVDEVFSYLTETSQELLEEIKNHDNPMRELCYILGTSSESDINYTLTSRVTILIAILSFFDIKFDL